jgi:hypothetical protein
MARPQVRLGADLAGDPLGTRFPSACQPSETTCPVSLKMRHGERHYLPRLKYVRQSAPSVVSQIMRQVRKSLALSYQVSGAGASSLSSAPPADQTVALWRRGTWTTLDNGSCRDAQIDPSGRSTDGHIVDQFADHIDSSLFEVSRGGVVERDDEVRGELMTAPEFDK